MEVLEDQLVQGQVVVDQALEGQNQELEEAVEEQVVVVEELEEAVEELGEVVEEQAEVDLVGEKQVVEYVEERDRVASQGLAQGLAQGLTLDQDQEFLAEPVKRIF